MPFIASNKQTTPSSLPVAKSLLSRLNETDKIFPKDLVKTESVRFAPEKSPPSPPRQDAQIPAGGYSAKRPQTAPDEHASDEAAAASAAS